MRTVENLRRCLGCKKFKPLTPEHFGKTADGVLSARCLLCRPRRPSQARKVRRAPIRPLEEIARIRALMAQWRTRDIRAMPAWLDESQLVEMEAKYIEAAQRTASTKIPYHVDHIEPLCGVDRSGLHVPWNLQVITAQANAVKGNR